MWKLFFIFIATLFSKQIDLYQSTRHIDKETKTDAFDQIYLITKTYLTVLRLEEMLSIVPNDEAMRKLRETRKELYHQIEPLHDERVDLKPLTSTLFGPDALPELTEEKEARYKTFLLNYAEKNAPELTDLREKMARLEHALGQMKTGLPFPGFSLFGHMNRDFVDNTFGPEGAEPRLYPRAEVGFNISYPIVPKDLRRADKNHALYALYHLKTKYYAEKEALQERVSDATEKLLAAYRGIALAGEIVASAPPEWLYRASLTYTDAFYDYYAAYLELERCIGLFDFTLSREERELVRHALLGINDEMSL